MQSTGVAEMDVTSELTDLREVPLQEMLGMVPVAVSTAVLRVIPGTDLVAPGPTFNSTI